MIRAALGGAGEKIIGENRGKEDDVFMKLTATD